MTKKLKKKGTKSESKKKLWWARYRGAPNSRSKNQWYNIHVKASSEKEALKKVREHMRKGKARGRHIVLGSECIIM